MGQNKKWYGEPLLTADASNTRVYSPFKFTKNVNLRAFRFRIIVHDAPALTSIGGRVYGDDGSVGPGAKIADSTDTRTFAGMLVNDNGIVETYVNFDDIPLRKDTDYHFLLTLNGYTGTTAKHIAFEKGYPDPVTKSLADRTYNALKTNPFYAYPIFAIR